VSNCPSCGAPLPERSVMPYVTCAYCRTLILRSGLSLEEVGKVAVLPPDVSPVQLGTSFRIGDALLTVIGRVRWGWADGSWNEWLLSGGDGDEHWLGEAMGAFMLTRARPDLLVHPLIAAFASGGGDIPVGTRIEVEGVTLTAVDCKEAQCLGSEGDLPFATLPGRVMASIDFRGPDREAVSIQRDERGPSAWLGHYSDLAALAPGNLRKMEGWTIPGGLER